MSIKISEINRLFLSDQELGLFPDEQEQPSPKVLKVSPALLGPLSSPSTALASRSVTIEHPASATSSETSVAEKSDPFNEDCLALLQTFPKSDYPKANNSMFARALCTEYQVSASYAYKKCGELMGNLRKLQQKTSWKLTPSISEKFLQFYQKKAGPPDKERDKTILEAYEALKKNNTDIRSEYVLHEAIGKEFHVSRGACNRAVERAQKERKKMDPADVEVEQYLAPDDKVAKVQEHFDVKMASVVPATEKKKMREERIEEIKEDFIILIQAFPKSEYPLITNNLYCKAMNTKHKVAFQSLMDKYKELIKDEEALKQKPQRELSKSISEKFLELYQNKERGIKQRNKKYSDRDSELKKEYKRLRELKPGATPNMLHNEIGEKYGLTRAAVFLALSRKRKR